MCNLSLDSIDDDSYLIFDKINIVFLIEQLNAALPQNLIILLVSVLLFSFFSISYVIGYFLGSRRYTFYRDWMALDFTVTRYLIGFFPI